MSGGDPWSYSKSFKEYFSKRYDVPGPDILTQRYVFTKNGGALNLKHVLIAAKGYNTPGVSADYILEQGLKTELEQAKAGHKSGYAFADLSSNKIGIEFGKYWNGRTEDLPNQLEKFINDKLGGFVQPPSDNVIAEYNKIKNFSDQPVLNPNGADILTDTTTGIRYKSSGDATLDRILLNLIKKTGADIER